MNKINGEVKSPKGSFLPVTQDPLTIILSYLDARATGNVSKVNKQAKENIKDYRLAADDFILELVAKNKIKDIDDLIFKLAMKQILVPEKLNRQQLLKYYLKSKKYSNDKSINQFIKALIEAGRFTKEDILSRVYWSYGPKAANIYITAFDSEDVQKELLKYLTKLHRTYNRTSEGQFGTSNRND